MFIDIILLNFIVACAQLTSAYDFLFNKNELHEKRKEH